MSRLNINGSWLPRWNSSSTSLPESEVVPETKSEANPENIGEPQASAIETASQEQTSTKETVHELRPTEQGFSEPKLPIPESQINLEETKATEHKVQISEAPHRKKRQSSLTLKHKTSTNSLASMSAGTWLSWTPRARTGSHEEDEDENIDESPEEDDEGEDDVAEENDEVDDHVVHNRKKLWSFWNASEVGGPKEPEKPPTDTANTILKSTPSLPSRDDLKPPRISKLESVNDESESPEEDDAVLYKPHDSATQFSKINTHKNENLKENVIVPDWESCLHHQNSVAAYSASQASILNGATNQSFDLKNWRNYLTHLSSRLGFGAASESSPSARPDRESTQTEMEKEFNSMYERSYRLYGRSLLKVPQFKRASLPTYSKLSAEDGTKRQNEEDAEDNSVSITNDSMGNLLINQRNRQHSKPVADVARGPVEKIRKILVIGVHGFFPTRMIRPLIGAPKGTSLKFANEAERAILRYCVDNDLLDERESHNISIQKIALEKEGKIFDRVEFFTEILTKWQKELNDADFIFVASHSQGCVVSIILLARLILMGILRDPLRKRIGILGMAGVNNGPFYGLDKTFFMKAYSAIEHNSLNELFELTKFDSPQSLAYKESMQIIVNANVKLCFIGSINDQLVPLYSALASHVFHPNIYRACYIDHSSRTPEFIQKLVSLCCQLQNLGYFDNNVIKELSTVLAGPLTGNGHSKIYNDGKVYDLGIKFVLDTDDLITPQDVEFNEPVKTPVTNQIYVKEYNIGKIGTNPFILPWCLRGLIFNVEKNWPASTSPIILDHSLERSKTGIEEINHLYELFDKWRPDSKVLKDLKFRLNGIRASKL